ncbi:hypothetical protein [Wolbachia endosymbiont of Armadillidium arcangelii]|uniref:Uncharacterized protein n=1 Tax=Wolbachia endosymbiont of Armadillidium arcangelii TaxID=3158571 RepID=A0AAU7Q1N4_9RICK
MYEVSKPCNELKDAIAQAMLKPGNELNEVHAQPGVSSELVITA